VPLSQLAILVVLAALVVVGAAYLLVTHWF
jgi:hypothetical protein